MFALDTNTLIYFFKDQGHVKERLLGTRPSQIAVPAVVIYELEVGIAKSEAAERHRCELSLLLERVLVVSLGPEEARSAALIRADLEERGTPIGPIDSLIAGTALHHSAVLVTHNTKEFRRVRGLEVVDWYY